MNQSQHDELAQLFAQNMRLAQTAAPPTQQQPPMMEHVTPQTEKQAQQPVHFVSSHYTQTAHLRPDTTSEPSRSPPPPYDESFSIMPEALAELLRRHSIDPSALLPTQVQLFLNANDEQRSRLLELWRISPPSYPLEEHLHGSSSSSSGGFGARRRQQTSLEQEEAEARERYEQRAHQQEQQRFAPEEHMLDTPCADEPISPIREVGEPAWPPAARMRAASIAALAKSSSRNGEAEPYIVNGYHEAHPAQALDPVYAAAAGLWQAPSYAQAVHEQSVLENQYGMYQQIRNHADWERMNEQIAREKFVGLHGPIDTMADDDMVM